MQAAVVWVDMSDLTVELRLPAGRQCNYFDLQAGI